MKAQLLSAGIISGEGSNIEFSSLNRRFTVGVVQNSIDFDWRGVASAQISALKGFSVSRHPPQCRR